MPPGDARYHRPLRVFFDVDDTLVSWDEKLRPHVHDVFEQLKKDGHEIYIWSGVGPRQDIADRFSLHPYISGLYRKPVYNYAARVRQFSPFIPDFCVDDSAEIIAAFGGVVIRPPAWIIEKDTEMWRIYDVLAHLIGQLSQAKR